MNMERVFFMNLFIENQIIAISLWLYQREIYFFKAGY